MVPLPTRKVSTPTLVGAAESVTALISFCQLLAGAPAEVNPNIEPLPSMASSRDVASGTLSQSVRRVLDGGGVPTTQAGGGFVEGQPVKNKSEPAALTNAGRWRLSRRQAWDE